MFKIVVSVLLAILFSACATRPSAIKPYEKAFDAEDVYIMYALRAEQTRNFATASQLFEQLYEKSEKKEYLYRSLKDQYIAKEYAQLIAKIDTILADDPLKDARLVRIKIVALAQLEKLQQAQSLAMSLAKQTNDAEDYLLVADMLIKTKEYEKALRYLDSAYMKDYSEKILDKIAILLYVNLGKKKEAIARLETHSRVHGCSELICNRLLGIYSNENNIDGMLAVYKRKYELRRDKDVAEKIIQIYGYKRDYVKLMNFLEQSHEDDALLLELYVSAKDFKKAQKLAKKLYEKEGVIDYLGQSAIYEYEANKEDLNETTLLRVADKLEEVVKRSSDPLYKNYLGYLLIDHDIDVSKGMRYVKDVLKVKPDSGYYLDSLAWGYYKLGECKKAYKLMQRVKTLQGGDDPEVDLHIQKIKQCLQKHTLTKE
ncbi:MAG: hypothetical protein FAF05_04095 [Epsilonproteobacteria bacterium]|nr:hypothetical protein [Campylobacterota bacterium]